MPSPTTLFEDAVDVPAWLELDARVPLTERTHRDREIGKSLAPTGPAEQVRNWWRQVDRGGYDGPGSRLQRARQWLNLVLFAVGAAAGVSVALAAFRYDGSYPVNVVRLLGLLVAPQLALLLLSLLLVPRRLPGLRPVQDALASINPGALATSMLARLGPANFSATASTDWAAPRSMAARRVSRWQMLYWSQIAAVGFNIAAISTAVVLIAFTDLAFGWSTTLDVDARVATRVVSTIAAPWEWWAPDAVPDAALVEQSRYFRLEGGAPFAPNSPRTLAAWWPFSLLAICTYGLLPRLLFCLVAGWRLNAATRALLLDDPRVTALLDRMSAPEIATSTEHPSSDTPPPRLAGGAPPPRVNGAANAVIWNDCVETSVASGIARDALGLSLEFITNAGGGHSLEDDRAALRAAASGGKPVLVITPAWEPPLLEFTDFLSQLRAAVGAAPSIVVLPVGESGAPCTGLERETWARAVQRSADPHVYVEAVDA
jgi:hypothetical protein